MVRVSLEGNFFFRFSGANFVMRFGQTFTVDG
jgi:hypothetical protein